MSQLSSSPVYGRWYTADSSHQQSAQLDQLDDERVQITSLPELRVLSTAAIDSLHVSSRLGVTPRQLRFADGAKFETLDNDAIDALLSRTGSNRGRSWLNWLEGHWQMVLPGLLIVMAVAWLFIQYGMPWLAKTIANAMSPGVMQTASQQTLKLLDETMLSESGLSEQEQQRLRQTLLADFDKGGGEQLTLLFRRGEAIGPNAMALPDGTIIITDELIKLAHTPEELLAVMAHEVGHVKHRHGMQATVQNTMLVLLAMLLVGDNSGIAELFTGIPLLLLERQYSRQFEHEADDYAKQFLQTAGIDRSHFINLLNRLDLSAACYRYYSARPEADLDISVAQQCLSADTLAQLEYTGKLESAPDGTSSWQGYLSTHPNTQQRRDNLLR